MSYGVCIKPLIRESVRSAIFNDRLRVADDILAMNTLIYIRALQCGVYVVPGYCSCHRDTRVPADKPQFMAAVACL